MKSPILTCLLPAVLLSGLLAVAPAAQERSSKPAPSTAKAQRGAGNRIETPAARPAPTARPAAGISGLSDVSDLAGVRKAFAHQDLDSSGRINFAEATRSGYSRPMFQGFDSDSSGGIDREEFTISFHQLLADTRRPVGSDLDAEAARLRALQKQRREEAQKRRVHEARLVPAPEGPTDSRVAPARHTTGADVSQQRTQAARETAAGQKAQHERQANARREAAAKKAEHERTANARREAAAKKAEHERTANARREAESRNGQSRTHSSRPEKDARHERIQNARRDQYGGQNKRGTGASQREAGKGRPSGAERGQQRPPQQGAHGKQGAHERKRP